MGSKIYNLFILIFVTVSTFIYLPHPEGVDVVEWGYQAQELFFRYGVIMLFGLSLFLKPIRQANFKIIGVFLVYAVAISSLFGMDIASRKALLNIFLGIIFYKLVFEYSDLDLKKIGTWFFWILFANFVMTWLQFFKLDPIYQTADPRLLSVGFWEPSGFMGITPHVGSLAVICSPLLFYVHPLLTLLVLPMLWTASNSTAILAFLVIMFFMLKRILKPKIFYPIVVLGFLTAIYYVIFQDMPGGEFQRRFIIWHESLKHVLRESPFFGMGLGGFAKLAPVTQTFSKSILGNQTQIWIWAHNEFFQVLFELGLVGFFILMAWTRERFRDFNKTVDDKSFYLFMSFISICFISFMHFPFHVARFAGICVFLMATFQASTHTSIHKGDSCLEQ